MFSTSPHYLRKLKRRFVQILRRQIQNGAKFYLFRIVLDCCRTTNPQQIEQVEFGFKDNSCQIFTKVKYSGYSRQ